MSGHLALRLTVIVLLFSLSISAQKRSDAMPVPTTVHGRVLISGRAAPQGIRVTLELGGAHVADSNTDNSGQFEFRGLNAGLFDCIVSQPGYRTSTQPVDLRTATSAYTVFDLKPDTSSDEPNIPPEGPSGMFRTANVPSAALQEFNTGTRLFSAGKDLGKAIRSFQKATAIAPDFTEAHIMLGMAQLGQRNYEEAERTFQKAISLNSSFASAFIGLGEAENSLGKFLEANRTLERAVTLAPESPEAHYELAKSLWGLQRWQEAEPHVDHSLKLNPDYPDAHVLMGNILLRKHDAEGALKQFQGYLRLDPKGTMAVPTRQMVSKLQAAMKSAGR